MARFVAKYANYKHGIQNGRLMVLADGQRQEVVKEIIAIFTPGPAILSPDEVEQGDSKLVHTGLPIDKNTERHYLPSVLGRLSGFDTVQAQEANGWTDEERILVETKLRGSEMYGRDFIELDAAALTAPWSTYDSTSPTKIVGLATDLGISLNDVAAYERANRNDATVLFLIEDAQAAVQDEETEAPIVMEA